MGTGWFVDARPAGARELKALRDETGAVWGTFGSWAASRYGSLPEVCGPGAVYFDAMSVESIADTFLQLRADGELRARLVREGYANLERFSWQRAAAETEEVLRAAAG